MMGNMGGLMSKIPGLGKLGGGMPSPGSLAGLMSKGSSKPAGQSFASQVRKVDREKLKKLRRARKRKR